MDAMSIATKTGDAGTTALMYNRRVPKTHPRVEAYGSVDELNAGLGLARAQVQDAAVQPRLTAIQKDLVALMAELATATEDLPRFLRDGHTRIGAEATVKLDAWIQELEAQKFAFQGWATPGANLSAAA